MMKKQILWICFTLLLTWNIQAQSYNDTARSTAMMGAHSAATLDGFEAMLYNPAGLAAGNSRFGLQILGGFSFDIFGSCFNLETAVSVLEQLQAGKSDIEPYISTMRKQSLYTGIQTGVVMPYNLLRLFFQTKYFSLGFSDQIKMRGRTYVGDDFFSAVFDKIDVTNGSSLGNVYADILGYNDFNVSFSMYLWMLERKIHLRGIYIGGGLHWYTPILHGRAELSSRVKTGKLNSKLDINDVDGSFYTYDLDLEGKVNFASPGAWSWNSTELNFANGVGPALGFGVDLGILADINRWVRIGFSVTDLGFMVAPATEIALKETLNIDLQNINALSEDLSNMWEDLKNDGGTGSTEVILAPLAMRLGATVTPYANRFMNLELPLTLTVTDFDLASGGFPATFGVSTGVEFTVKAGFFAMPLWTSIGYFTSSGIAVGFGGGLHLGVCHLDLGIRGLESLMLPSADSLFGRELAVALQLSFQLKKKTDEVSTAPKKEKKKQQKKIEPTAPEAISVEVENIETPQNTVETPTTDNKEIHLLQ